VPAAERTVATTTVSLEPSLSTSAAISPDVVDHGDLDPEAVVVAAVLIASGGDLEAAIVDGWITQEVAEAALVGIEDGSLAALLD